jgi:hypothetical protein
MQNGEFERSRIGNRRLQLSPDVPPYQCVREGSAGNLAKKENKKVSDRSRYMYENKQNDDIFTEIKPTFLHN